MVSDRQQVPSDCKRVLVVDDEPGLAELVAEYLTRIDDALTVDTASNGPAALTAVHDSGRSYCCIV